jgi:hypothetical protein
VADLVIAMIDAVTRAVITEIFALRLHIQERLRRAVDASPPNAGLRVMHAYACDGHFHLAYGGKYQGIVRCHLRLSLPKVAVGRSATQRRPTKVSRGRASTVKRLRGLARLSR